MAATSQIQEMTVHPLEATPLVGHVAIRVLSGRIRILGYDFAPASDDEDEHWFTLHSPAGGLTAVLQTPSAISCGARVLLRSLSESIGFEAATAHNSGKRKRQAKELEDGEGGEGGEGGEDGEDGEDDLDDPIDDPRPSAPGRGRAASAAGNNGSVEEARLGIRLLKGVPCAVAEGRLGGLGALVPVAWAAALQTLAGSLSVPPPGTAPEDEPLSSESPPGVGEGGTDAKGSAQNDALPIEQTLRALKTTLRALNVSLVGLLVPPARVVVGASGGAETAVPPSGGGSAEHEEAPATAPDGSGGWSDHECVGLGLVRSVDVPNGLIFLSTPAPPEQLARVRVLVRAALEVPLALFQPTALTGASPFLVADALKAAGTGGERMKSRNNIGRASAGLAG
eukprot:jgi/Chrpa1/107/Chrysochromulina_OHIO_Genome00012724-RA